MDPKTQRAFDLYMEKTRKGRRLVLLLIAFTATAILALILR